MSWQYSVFDKPKTLEEFARKMKRKDYTEIDVDMKIYNDLFDHYTRAFVRCGKHVFKMPMYASFAENRQPFLDLADKNLIAAKAANDMVGAFNYLTGYGFDVSVFGDEGKDADRILKRFENEIDEYKDILPLVMPYERKIDIDHVIPITFAGVGGVSGYVVGDIPGALIGLGIGTFFAWDFTRGIRKSKRQMANYERRMMLITTGKVARLR